MRKTLDVKVDTFDCEEGNVTTCSSQIKPGCGFGHVQL